MSAELPELGRSLGHYDPEQLWFQLAEIVNERVYVRHGIEVGHGDVVLDVGANVGVAAAFFAAHCEAAAVHSFEPVRPLFEQLERNVSAYPACVPHHYGLGAADAEATITFYPRSAAMSGVYADPDRDRAAVLTYLRNIGADDEDARARLADHFEGEELSCRLRTLSGAIEREGIERVDLLKIDVERAEHDVIAGIDAEDWSLIRQVVVEVHDTGGRLEAISGELDRHGFEVVTEQDAQWRGTDIHMLYARRP